MAGNLFAGSNGCSLCGKVGGLVSSLDFKSSKGLLSQSWVGSIPAPSRPIISLAEFEWAGVDDDRFRKRFRGARPSVRAVEGGLVRRNSRKAQTGCPLCSIARNDEKVENLGIHRSGSFIVAANLYPYNPGHLMIFPERHVSDIRELNEAEDQELLRLEKFCISILEDVYQPAGFNIGYNLGRSSGASVEHLHLHIVPRYTNEAGFLDILTGTRVMVEDPKETVAKLRQVFADRSDTASDKTAR